MNKKMRFFDYLSACQEWPCWSYLPAKWKRPKSCRNTPLLLDDPLFKETRLYFKAIFALYDKADYETAKQLIQEITAISYRLWLEGLNAINLFGSMIFQGLIALMQGKLTEAQQLSQKLFEYAAVRNNYYDKVRAESLEALIMATLGQYEDVNENALKNREGDVLLFGPFGRTLVAYGRGNHQQAIVYIVQAWSVPIVMRWLSILLQYVPVVAAILADQGQYTRAVSLLAMAREHPACPRGWWEIMVLVRELESRLETELSDEQYAAAQAKGREMDVRQTAESLLQELKAMTTEVDEG
jgi:tetratricopeptide (TPR) repeat protein